MDFIPPSLINKRTVSCSDNTYRDLVSCVLKYKAELEKSNHDKQSIEKIINKMR